MILDDKKLLNATQRAAVEAELQKDVAPIDPQTGAIALQVGGALVKLIMKLVKGKPPQWLVTAVDLASESELAKVKAIMALHKVIKEIRHSELPKVDKLTVHLGLTDGTPLREEYVIDCIAGTMYKLP